MGIIKSYLNTPVPANWNKMTIAKRHYFVENGETDGEEDAERFPDCRNLLVIGHLVRMPGWRIG